MSGDKADRLAIDPQLHARAALDALTGQQVDIRIGIVIATADLEANVVTLDYEGATQERACGRIFTADIITRRRRVGVDHALATALDITLIVGNVLDRHRTGAKGLPLGSPAPIPGGLKVFKENFRSLRNGLCLGCPFSRALQDRACVRSLDTIAV